jgi:hypothetical protein
VEALGPPIFENSFEDLVHGSSDIVVCKVRSVENADPEDARQVVRTQVDITASVKGRVKPGIADFSYERYVPWDFDLEERSEYLLFLSERPDKQGYTYSKPYWSCWKKVRGKRVSCVRSHFSERPLRLERLVNAVRAELDRKSTALPTSFLGIDIGHSLVQAQKGSGITFTKYKENWNEDERYKYYYSFLPKDSKAHMVRVMLYSDRIATMDIYYLRDCEKCPTMPLEELVSKCGGISLKELPGIDQYVGRRWRDENVEVGISGNFRFVESNGYPWGAFAACYVSITDQEFVRERQSGE